MAAESVSLRPATEADLAEWERTFPTGHVFHSRDWLFAWFRTYARRPVLATIRHEGEVAGAWMLESASGVIRGGAALGCDYQSPRWRSDVGPELRAPLVQRALGELASRRDVHLVHLREVPGVPHAEPDSPTMMLCLPATFEDYLGTIPAHVRRDVRRGLDAVSLVPREHHDAAFRELVRLHGARWRRRGLPGAFFGRRLAFHRRLVQSDSARLYQCVRDGRVVGVLYTLRDAQAVRYYQAGIDSSAGKISPGTAMIGAAIRDAIAEGAGYFDFLRGDERYKRQWRPQLRAQNGRFLLQGRSAMGRLALPAGRIVMAIEQHLRARVELSAGRSTVPTSGGELPSNG